MHFTDFLPAPDAVVYSPHPVSDYNFLGLDFFPERI